MYTNDSLDKKIFTSHNADHSHYERKNPLEENMTANKINFRFCLVRDRLTHHPGLVRQSTILGELRHAIQKIDNSRLIPLCSVYIVECDSSELGGGGYILPISESYDNREKSIFNEIAPPLIGIGIVKKSH